MTHCQFYSAELYSYAYERLSNFCYEMHGRRAYFKIHFDTPVDPQRIDRAPYDPYLKVKRRRKSLYDIHLAGKEPLPNSQNPKRDNGFRDANGYPWGLLVPDDWLPPMEKRHIQTAYLNFSPWRESRGREDTDWYLHPEPGQVDTDTVVLASKATSPSTDGAFIELDVQSVELIDSSGVPVRLKGFPKMLRLRESGLHRLFNAQAPPTGSYKEIRITLGNGSQKIMEGMASSLRLPMLPPAEGTLKLAETGAR